MRGKSRVNPRVRGNRGWLRAGLEGLAGSHRREVVDQGRASSARLLLPLPACAPAASSAVDGEVSGVGEVSERAARWKRVRERRRGERLVLLDNSPRWFLQNVQGPCNPGLSHPKILECEINKNKNHVCLC
jgi:hypothetical protein